MTPELAMPPPPPVPGAIITSANDATGDLALQKGRQTRTRKDGNLHLPWVLASFVLVKTIAHSLVRTMITSNCPLLTL